MLNLCLLRDWIDIFNAISIFFHFSLNIFNSQQDPQLPFMLFCTYNKNTVYRGFKNNVLISYTKFMLIKRLDRYLQCNKKSFHLYGG